MKTLREKLTKIGSGKQKSENRLGGSRTRRETYIKPVAKSQSPSCSYCSPLESSHRLLALILLLEWW